MNSRVSSAFGILGVIKASSVATFAARSARFLAFSRSISLDRAIRVNKVFTVGTILTRSLAPEVGAPPAIHFAEL